MDKEFIYTPQRIKKFYTKNKTIPNHLSYLKRTRGNYIKAKFPQALNEEELMSMVDLRFFGMLRGIEIDLSDSQEAVTIYNNRWSTLPIWNVKTGEVKDHTHPLNLNIKNEGR